MVRWFGLAMALCGAVCAQTTSVDVTATDWLDTGVDLRAGDVVVLSSSGTLTLTQGKTVGPAGQPRGFRDLIKNYPANDAGLGALIGRIGSSDAAVPFVVGEAKRLEVPRTGRLFLYLNRSGKDALAGAIHSNIQFLSRGPETPVSFDASKLPAVTAEMIDRIPRRVVDAEGNLGDNTNFVVVGSEQKVIATFAAAGWVKVDKTRREALITGFLESLSKQAYLELPMSELTLYGRSQDYGLAHAEPVSVAEKRHHLRLWKAPFQVEGQELWVGAATHDIGFDQDARNNGITHKIDPNVDDERDFVGRSLDETGRVARLSYTMPGQPSIEARTATGATFHSDGRMLVVHLIPDR
jgi:hypothetical protein